MRKPTYAGDEGGSADRMKKAGLVGVSDERYRKFFGDAVCASQHGSMILHRDTIGMQVIVGQDSPMQLPEYISSRGIVTGMKVDAGMAKIGDQRFVGSVTELPWRLEEAVKAGARFTKFRFAFAPNTPKHVLRHGAMQLALYCVASLQHDLVPYPEPELERSLLKGSFPDMVNDTMVTMLTLLMEQLVEFGVDLKKIILKTNLLEFGHEQTPDKIASQTFHTLKPWFQSAGGVKLLSGGQTADEAFSRTTALAGLVAKEAWDHERDYPRLSTSFSRACMEGVLELWRDKDASEAQKLFVTLSERNAAALV